MTDDTIDERMAALTWPQWRGLLLADHASQDEWDAATVAGLVMEVAQSTLLGDAILARLREKLDGMTDSRERALRVSSGRRFEAWWPVDASARSVRWLIETGFCNGSTGRGSYVIADQGRAALHLLEDSHG